MSRQDCQSDQVLQGSAQPLAACLPPRGPGCKTAGCMRRKKAPGSCKALLSRQPAKRALEVAVTKQHRPGCGMDRPAAPASDDVLHKRRATGFSVLYDRLQRLCPPLRKEIIVRGFTQKQRLELEQWICAHKRQADTSNCTASEQGAAGDEDCSMETSCLRSGVEHCRGVHRPEMKACFHLSRHLYAQAASVADALEHQGVLASFQAEVSAAGEACGCSSAFEEKVKLLAEELPVQLQFRTRISFTRGARLTTPLRSDVALALDDWREMDQAWNKELFSGGRLLPSATPAQAEEQWRRTSAVWKDLWAKHRGCGPTHLVGTFEKHDLGRSLCWRRILCQWQRQQQVAVTEVLKLLTVGRNCGSVEGQGHRLCEEELLAEVCRLASC